MSSILEIIVDNSILLAIRISLMSLDAIDNLGALANTSGRIILLAKFTTSTR